MTANRSLSAQTLLSVLPALALGACNLAPPYARPVAAVPPALPQGIPGYPAVEPGQARDLARIGWREFFLDDRLRQVIALGLENNQDLQLAAANVLQARALYRVQRAGMFPTLSASGAATFTDAAAPGGGSGGGDGIHTFSADAGLTAFEIDLFGRLRNQSVAAQQQYFASEQGRRATRVSLIAEIATAWLTLAADREQAAISQTMLKTYAASLDLTRAQFRSGIASGLEMEQADTSFQSARNDVAVAQTRILQDLNALQLLTGATVPAELQPQDLSVAGAVLAQMPGELPSDVLLSRPDVLGAEHQLIAQNANIGVARAAFFPRISLTATLGVISTALGSLFSGGPTYTVAPSATVPLFDFGRNKGNLDYARASRDAAVATYQKTVQTAFREVADALAERGSIDERLAAQRARTAAAQRAVTIADARFRAGISSYLTVLDVQRSYYAAQQQLLATRLLRESNLVALYRSLGGGSD